MKLIFGIFPLVPLIVTEPKDFLNWTERNFKKIQNENLPMTDVESYYVGIRPKS